MKKLLMAMMIMSLFVLSGCFSNVKKGTSITPPNSTLLTNATVADVFNISENVIPPKDLSGIAKVEMKANFKLNADAGPSYVVPYSKFFEICNSSGTVCNILCSKEAVGKRVLIRLENNNGVDDVISVYPNPNDYLEKRFPPQK